jgi:mRNA interferase HicA
MKRADLVRKLGYEGCVLVRHGGNHDWYRNPKAGISQGNEFLAKHITR